MVDSTTFEGWAGGLGELVERLDDAVKVGGPLGVLVRPAGDDWEVVHERSLTPKVAEGAWGSADGRSTLDVMHDAAVTAAAGFPLVRGSAAKVRTRLVATLQAPLFTDGLSQQAFALTVSSVLRAVEAFDRLQEGHATGRAVPDVAPAPREPADEEPAAAATAAPAAETEPVTAPAATTTAATPMPAAPATAPESQPAGFRPTHVVVPQGGRAWQHPDPNAPMTPLPGSLPVKVVEERGMWAHIVIESGWEAWADLRELVRV